MAYVRRDTDFDAWFDTRIQQRGVRRLTEAIADDARAGCPIDSGELVESIGTRYPGKMRGMVIVGTDHWVPTEFGSPAHEIRPRKKKALAWPGGLHPVGKVDHPGTPEQPFMRPALYRRRNLSTLQSRS